MSAEEAGTRLQMDNAIQELQAMIRQRYPDAQFTVDRSPEDASIVHLMAVVDLEDTEEVLDLVIDRMMEMQIEEELPIFVIPTRPLERSLQIYQAQKADRERRAGKVGSS